MAAQLWPSLAQRTCPVCAISAPKYTCPRCSTPYCSVACFQKHSSACTEAFAKDHVSAMTRVLAPADGQRGATEAALVRTHEAEAGAEQMQEALDRDTAVPQEHVYRIAEALAAGRDVSSLLTPEVERAIDKAAARGQLSDAVAGWQPWWLRAGISEEGGSNSEPARVLPGPSEPSDELAAEEVAHARLISAVQGAESAVDIVQPPQWEASRASSQSLVDLLGPGKTPHPSVALQVVQLVLAYAYTLRQWHGEVPANEAASALLTLAPCLWDAGAAPSSVQAAVQELALAVVGRGHATDVETRRALCGVALEDAQALLGSACKTGRVVAHVQLWLKEAMDSLPLDKAARRRVKAGQRKAVFLLAWVVHMEGSERFRQLSMACELVRQPPSPGTPEQRPTRHLSAEVVLHSPPAHAVHRGQAALAASSPISAPTMATKIVDLVKAKEEAKEPFVAFEYFPPRTDKGLENLYRRVQLMKHQAPMYVDVTWGAGGSTSDLTLDMCVKMKTEYGLEPNMHLTCTNMEAEKVDIALEGAKAANIANIVALRGDPPKGQEEWTATEGGFTCALDLIKYIREKHGDYFCLSTAGYPEGHPNVIKEVADASSLSESEKGRLVELDGKQFVCSDEDYGKEMAYLKAKVDAGADMIITQMFFDVPVFLTFVQDCRDAGITVPIVPGLMVIQAYGGFNRMTAFCKSRVPAWVRDSLEAVKDDEAAVKAQGIAIGTKMCQDLLAAGVVPLHFYCLNQEKATFAIMENLGMLKAAAEEEGATAAAAEATASA